MFNSYAYSCKTDLEEGKFWALTTVDFDIAEYFKLYNDKPIITDFQILLSGYIQTDLFTPEVKFKAKYPTHNLKDGKYWCVFEITEKINEFVKIEKEQPKGSIEGTINIREKENIEDEIVTEKMFYRYKERDDHRHHAVDAITIALTERSYLQKLSTWNAAKKDKQRGVQKEHIIFDLPWKGFPSHAKNAIDNILISFRFNDKVLTKIKKKITKNGQVVTSVGYSVRGELHKEFVFGKHPIPIKNDTGQFLFDENKNIKLKTDKKGDV